VELGRTPCPALPTVGRSGRKRHRAPGVAEQRRCMRRAGRRLTDRDAGHISPVPVHGQNLLHTALPPPRSRQAPHHSGHSDRADPWPTQSLYCRVFCRLRL